MKKHIRILLIVFCALLLIPRAASANAPAPDPLRIDVACENVEPGTVILAMFAGEDGGFHPDEIYGASTVSETTKSVSFHRSEHDTRMYLELTRPDGSTVQSNTLPVTADRSFRYDGKTNTLSVRAGSSSDSCIGGVLLFLLMLVAEILGAFALTVLIEFLVGLCFGMKPFRYILIANLITNIPMNIVLLLLNSVADGIGYWIALVVLELIVVLVEFLFWRKKYKDRRTWYVLLFAVAANVASLAAGLLLNHLIF